MALKRLALIYAMYQRQKSKLLVKASEGIRTLKEALETIEG